jgi:hypothetical protein
MDLEYCDHILLTFCFSVVFNWLPIVDGGTAGELLLGEVSLADTFSPMAGQALTPTCCIRPARLMTAQPFIASCVMGTCMML